MSNTSFTITEQSLEQEFKAKMNPADYSALQRAYTAGLRFAFSPQTHGQVLQQFERDLQTHPDAGAVIGTDVAHLMIMLINESKGTIPQQVVGPCAILLLAKACEFISTTHVAEITDVTFAEAVKVLVAGVSQAVDPNYRNKVNGGAQATAAPAASPASASPIPPTPGAGGLLAPQTQGGV